MSFPMVLTVCVYSVVVVYSQYTPARVEFREFHLWSIERIEFHSDPFNYPIVPPPLHYFHALFDLVIAETTPFPVPS